MRREIRILKTFQVIAIKLRHFRNSITKMLLRDFGCKMQTKRPFIKTLTRFWTTNSVKYENVIIGAIKRNASDLELRKGNTRSENQAFVLFI